MSNHTIQALKQHKKEFISDVERIKKAYREKRMRATTCGSYGIGCRVTVEEGSFIVSPSDARKMSLGTRIVYDGVMSFLRGEM